MSKKCCEDKHVDLLLIAEEGKRPFVLINYFNMLMYDQTLQLGKNVFDVIDYKLSVQRKY